MSVASAATIVSAAERQRESWANAGQRLVVHPIEQRCDANDGYERGRNGNPAEWRRPQTPSAPTSGNLLCSRGDGFAYGQWCRNDEQHRNGGIHSATLSTRYAAIRPPRSRSFTCFLQTALATSDRPNGTGAMLSAVSR